MRKVTTIRTRTAGRRRAATLEALGAAALTLLATAATAQAQQQAPAITLDEIIVTAHKFREVEIGKANISLIETPQAVSIISADLIKERGITDINDALVGVAGVSRSSTYGFFDAYTIRGYDTALDSLYLDGLITSNAFGTNNELAGLERVEVLKGPASALSDMSATKRRISGSSPSPCLFSTGRRIPGSTPASSVHSGVRCISGWRPPPDLSHDGISRGSRSMCSGPAISTEPRKAQDRSSPADVSAYGRALESMVVVLSRAGISDGLRSSGWAWYRRCAGTLP